VVWVTRALCREENLQLHFATPQGDGIGASVMADFAVAGESNDTFGSSAAPERPADPEL
jgi:hypothetical protein